MLDVVYKREHCREDDKVSRALEQANKYNEAALREEPTNPPQMHCDEVSLELFQYD